MGYYTEILGVDEKEQLMDRAQTRLMKNSAHTPTIVPLAQSQGPSVPTKTIEMQEGDVGIGVDLDIKKQIEAPKLSTQVKGIPATSTSAPTSSLESVGASLVPPHPSTTTVATSIPRIFGKFLQSLVESQRATGARLWAIEIDVATLYGQI